MVEIQAINNLGTGKKDKLETHFRYRIVLKYLKRNERKKLIISSKFK